MNMFRMSVSCYWARDVLTSLRTELCPEDGGLPPAGKKCLLASSRCHVSYTCVSVAHVFSASPPCCWSKLILKFCKWIVLLALQWIKSVFITMYLLENLWNAPWIVNLWYAGMKRNNLKKIKGFIQELCPELIKGNFRDVQTVKAFVIP